MADAEKPPEVVEAVAVVEPAWPEPTIEQAKRLRSLTAKEISRRAKRKAGGALAALEKVYKTGKNENAVVNAAKTMLEWAGGKPRDAGDDRDEPTGEMSDEQLKAVAALALPPKPETK